MKILVVDDEKDMQTLFEQRFRREIRTGEMQFAFAFSGEEALNYVHKHEHEVVLILSDINMPGMSGLVLLEKIKQEFSIPPPAITNPRLSVSAQTDRAIPSSIFPVPPYPSPAPACDKTQCDVSPPGYNPTATPR